MQEYNSNPEQSRMKRELERKQKYQERPLYQRLVNKIILTMFWAVILYGLYFLFSRILGVYING